MTNKTIGRIKARLAKRREPPIGTCSACGHRQEMNPSWQPAPTVVAEGQWKCQQCGGQIVVSMTIGDNGPGQDEDIQTLLTAWGDVSARLQQLEAERDEARAAFITEHAIHKQQQDNYSASWEHERALRNSGDDALDLALTAISQLAKEKESLQASLDQLHGAKFSDRVYHALKSRAEKAEATLAETRDALHQVQEKYDALTRRGSREISPDLQSSAATDAGHQDDSAERRTREQHSCVVCCAFSTESIDELIAHVRTHESRSADGDAQAMRKPGSGPLRGLDGNVPGDASDSHAGATSHSDRTERTGSLGANDDQVRRPVANDPAGSEPADSLP